MRVGRFQVVAVIVIVVLGLLVWAWADGGERELHPMSQDVSVPEQAK